MTDATYALLPWVRRGVGAAVSDPALLELSAQRASVEVAIGVTGVPDPLAHRLTLHGPGDVIGVEPREIVRLEPRRGTTDFEPNFFAHIEFDRPEFPWLFTPMAVGADNQLRPWCVLVVLDQDESTEVRAGYPLPVVTAPVAQLPDLADSYAWAHAQVVTPEGTPGVDTIDDDERLNLSRVICPRRLEPMRGYRACLVPAFDDGVDAGLGRTIDREEIGPAWGENSPATVDLPVYHTWDFATGPSGDFETLVERLRARDLPDGVGRRSMYIGRAGLGLPDLEPDDDGAILPREGALRDPEGPDRAPMPEPPRTQVQSALRTLVNATAEGAGGDGPDPLAPPLYGRWPARHHTAPPDGDPPRWLGELNLDPRDRAAAAIGARAVQVHQDDLVHAAWEQLGDVERANRKLRLLQFSREVATSLHRRHTEPMDAGTFLQLWGPAADRIPTPSSTLQAEITDTRLGAGVLVTAMRKALRPSGRIRRMSAAATISRGPLVADVNAGEVEPEPAWFGPDGAVVAAFLDDVQFVAGEDTVLPCSDGITIPSDIASALVELREPPPADLLVDVATVSMSSLNSNFQFVEMADVFAPIAGGAEELVAANVAVTEVFDATPPPVVSINTSILESLVLDGVVAFPTAAVAEVPTAADADAPQRFVDAMIVSLSTVAVAPEVVEPTPAADLGGARGAAQAATAPALRAALRAQAAIAVPDGVGRPPDPLDQILAAPSLPTPVVRYLTGAADDVVLPGLELVPPETLTVVETNPRFVAAVMVGFNHEMGRELVWRRFPHELRATVARRFWERPPDEVDIEPIHTWRKNSGLAVNVAGDPEGQAVLLIRGELLRRYPGTVISASEAVWAGGRRVLADPEVEQFPILGASVDPDITFRGFPFSVDTARGADDDSGRAGWFFVLASQPTEPRFGLDESSGPATGLPSSWADLEWSHMAQGAALDSVVHAPLDAFGSNATVDGLTWGLDSAHQAAITLQDPVRIIVHARELLSQAP